MGRLAGWSSNAIHYHQLNSVVKALKEKRFTLTYARDDTVTEPLRMKHVQLWLGAEVAQHLDSFCVLEYDMVFLDHRFHEVLIHHFAPSSPARSIIHDQHVVPSRD